MVSESAARVWTWLPQNSSLWSCTALGFCNLVAGWISKLPHRHFVHGWILNCWWGTRSGKRLTRQSCWCRCPSSFLRHLLLASQTPHVGFSLLPWFFKPLNGGIPLSALPKFISPFPELQVGLSNYLLKFLLGYNEYFRINMSRANVFSLSFIPHFCSFSGLPHLS